MKTYETAQDAVDRSISHTEIAELVTSDRAATLAELHALGLEGVDGMRSPGTYVAWGKTERGEWRIVIRVQS